MIEHDVKLITPEIFYLVTLYHNDKPLIVLDHTRRRNEACKVVDQFNGKEDFRLHISTEDAHDRLVLSYNGHIMLTGQLPGPKDYELRARILEVLRYRRREVRAAISTGAASDDSVERSKS